MKIAAETVRRRLAFLKQFPYGMVSAALALCILLFQLQRLGYLAARVPEAVAILLLSQIVYLAAVWRVLKRPPPLRFILVSAFVFRLLVWPSYPALSEDVYRYRWEGLVQSEGGNPYNLAPARYPRDATYGHIPGPTLGAVYGPLIEWVEWATQWTVSRLADGPFGQVFWHKLPGALADLGVMWALIALLRERGFPPGRVLIYAWSPLPVVEFWGSGHHDSLVILLLVLAMLARSQAREGWCYLFLGSAMAAKWWPALLVPAVLASGKPKWRHLLLLPLPLALSAPAYLPVQLQNARFASGFVGGWRNNDSLFGAILWIAPDLQTAKYAAFGLIAAAALVAAVLPRPLEWKWLVTTAALLLLSANCHPWYLAWFLPWLAFFPWPPLLLWTALAPLAYQVVIRWYALGEWDGSTEWRWLMYLPIAVFTVVSVILKVRVLWTHMSGHSAAQTSSSARLPS